MFLQNSQRTVSYTHLDVYKRQAGIRSVFHRKKRSTVHYVHSNRKGDVMLKYVLKRLGYILVTLWVIVTCTFFMMKNLPGTPFDAERFSIMTPQQQERVLEMYGLNDSLPMQYVKYIKNMLKGDLGTSFTYVNQDVSKVITGRLGPSALIGIQAVPVSYTHLDVYKRQQ